MSTDASSTVSTPDEELGPADSNVVEEESSTSQQRNDNTSTYPQQNDTAPTNISTDLETSQVHQDESVELETIPVNILELQAPGNKSAPTKEVDITVADSELVPMACIAVAKNGTMPHKPPQRQEHKAEDEGPEYFCGIGPCHPPWLQWLRDARVFTLLLCLFSIVEGALVTGLTASVLSTIERRYHLSSTATGALASTNDVSVIVSVIFITYIGAKGHKPRWLGTALVIEAIGAFVFSLPQFVLGHYRVQQFYGRESCNDGFDFLEDCGSSNNVAFVLFLIGNILIGLGAAPLFTIGTAYLDEIVHPQYTSIHLGIFYITAIVGPALGFGLSGLFLSIYVDPFIDTHLKPTDPGWVGAWWLCYIVCGTLCLIIAIPFFFYPRLLPNSEKLRLLREQEMALSGKTKKDSQSGRLQIVKDFPHEVKRVVTNFSWLFVTIGLACVSIAFSVFSAFDVKFSEIQFGLSASAASLIGGVRTIPSSVAGIIASILIIYIFKLKGRQLGVIALTACVLATLTVFALLLHCPTTQLAGVTIPYPDGTIGLPDTSSFYQNCTASCNCTSSVFEPVCGANNVVYFSPCHAGCPFIGNETGYEQCLCIADQLSTATISEMYSDVLELNSTASEGLCSVDCEWKLQLYYVITAFTLFFVFMLQVPNITITIRCVAEDQRTFALGLQSSILRLVGFVPGPILFGTIVDSSCLFWQHECGQRGNCWLYDRSTLSTRAILLATGTMSCYILFIILCWFVYPHQRADEKNSDYYLGDSTSLTNVELECSAADLHHGDQTSCNSASSVREGAVEMQTQ